MLVFLGLISCSAGDDADETKESEETAETGAPGADEICDDGIDNDGDGLVDCDDESCTCGDTGSDTSEPSPEIDTGSSSGVVEIQLDSQSCCDFTFNAQNCSGLFIGSFDVVNGTNTDGTIQSIQCEPLGGITSSWFKIGGAAPTSSIILQPILAGETIEVELIYDCAFLDTFAADCQASVEAGKQSDELGFLVRGTLAP